MKTLEVGTAGRNHWVTRFYSMLTALALAAGAVSMLAALGGIRTAGAHAGSSNPAEVHACMNNFGHVRIVDPSRECLSAETPLHWTVGGDSTAARWVVVENSRVPVQAQLANSFRGDREVTVMTRNVYVGASLIRPVNATNFAELVAAVTVVGPLVFRRGWAAVDTKIRGRTFRFITTHLETQDFPAVQLAQARELLQGPASTDLPVILLGDFNSRADGTGTATYATLRAAGFDDTWSIVRRGDPGFTCCQSEDLRNPVSGLGRRIDLILFRGDFEIVDADVVGEEPADRTASGLWPSDHAGVGATLELPGPHR